MNVSVLLVIGCSAILLVASPGLAERASRPAERETHRVESRLLQGVTYDGASKTLILAFADGSVYEYYGVDRSVFLDLVRVVNKGHYFNTHIRDVFRYRRVSGGAGYLARTEELGKEEGTWHR
jgi:hypothetical protein